MSSVHTQTIARTNSIIFMGDSVRGALRDVIRELGLNPIHLMTEWQSWVGSAVKLWMESGHLTDVHVEFFKPGATAIVTRWDLSVAYMGLGSDGDMWIDKVYLRQLIAKCPRPTAECLYRILLSALRGRPDAGTTNASFKSTGSLIPRTAGTIIATGHIITTATYWG